MRNAADAMCLMFNA